MFDLVVRRVGTLVAAPVLFALTAPALAQGPTVPERPQAVPPRTSTSSPGMPSPAGEPPATTVNVRSVPNRTPLRARAVMAQVVRLTNETRRNAGCPGLTVDDHLVAASLRQSNYMARTRLFSHVWRDGSTFVDRTAEAGYQQPAGENIAWGYRTVPEVMAAWMSSPGHRRNILNCKARSVGAGVAYAADGTPYYTQVFGWR
ncbi:uncharacterized protein YkwD [Actinoplanes campanulatus]|uniref:Uncharacterized protein YkwD n=1 Tax=Actinoplanes campanulatus TaxID=113559 RepID=A0A7W5AJS7_9ACTN|nr:CAP domain-containing protein [Actinoplanes campanulatus]MBB3097034.1 uncharacterized protein YkwD [Actinoplanes campanulatus]GGN15185.1 hypothetical protein GCM10010109_26920 [Actinoplanes campanulatus]GID37785.1 hypothetical protein Aca09nite_42910 [Actinoplanes campanulatus]